MAIVDARHRPILVLTLALAAAVAAVAGALAAAVAPAGAATRAAHLRAAHRRAAARDAAGLLVRVPLPPGAQRASAEPAGDAGALARPATRLGDRKLIRRHAWWRVDATPAAVDAWLRGHVPPGATLREWGASGGGSHPVDTVTYAWPPVAGTLGDRVLVVELTQLGSGVTAVRADAEVQWLLPRPDGERIPARARLLDVIVSVRGRRRRRTVVTPRRSVRAIAARINRLPIVQPTVVVCPEMPVRPRLTLLFRARAHGRVLARIGLTALARGQGSACDAVDVRIHGRARPALLGGPSVVRAVKRRLHIRLRAGHAPAPVALAARASTPAG